MKVQELFKQLVSAAQAQEVSDIYFLVDGDEYVVKFKEIAGLSTYRRMPLDLGGELINYLKYHARMDITEHRRPQVGSFQLPEKSCYLRLSSVGDFHGRESLVVRIIYRMRASKYFFPTDFTRLVEVCQGRGLVLTSGPTGSGKTTLMYQLAREVGQDKMVMCMEDPVEIEEPSFFQTQINLGAGITYPELLKAALRHRPDILIIGEIRDSVTAQLAVRASLSGHLVLATIHAMSTKGTVMRLLELGVSELELINALRGLTYQRLIKSTDDELNCLIDVGSGPDLMQVIEQPEQGFFTWSARLTQLMEEGKLSEQNAASFEFG